MAADGVVPVEPSERGEAGVVFVGVGTAALQGFAFQGGVERLGGSVVCGAPTALIDWRTPAAVQAAANALDVYCASSTCRCNTGLLDLA